MDIKHITFFDSDLCPILSFVGGTISFVYEIARLLSSESPEEGIPLRSIAEGYMWLELPFLRIIGPLLSSICLAFSISSLFSRSKKKGYAIFGVITSVFALFLFFGLDQYYGFIL